MHGKSLSFFERQKKTPRNFGYFFKTTHGNQITKKKQQHQNSHHILKFVNKRRMNEQQKMPTTDDDIGRWYFNVPNNNHFAHLFARVRFFSLSF